MEDIDPQKSVYEYMNLLTSNIILKLLQILKGYNAIESQQKKLDPSNECCSL